MRAISGTPLQESFHLGSTVIKDYGRSFESGFNNYTGLSGYAQAGRFLINVRGEFQRAPSAVGYSIALAEELSTSVDQVPFIDLTTGQPCNQATIPRGLIAPTTNGRLIDAYASVRVLNHEVSFGKQDDWLEPVLGAARDGLPITPVAISGFGSPSAIRKLRKISFAAAQPSTISASRL
jgi:hypothetical protein